MSNPNRIYVGKRASIHFSYLSDEDINRLILACQQELELRSQENMAVSEGDL